MPSQSVLIGSSSETSVFWLAILRMCIRISFSMQRDEYVASLMFRSGRKVLTALIRPMVPMEIRSSRLTPVFRTGARIHDKAKIMLDEQLLGCLVALFQRGDGLPLLLRLQRCGQHVAAADCT